MDDEIRPSGLPSSYGMSRKFEDHVLSSMGTLAGLQDFDNNTILQESFMKLLPQVLEAQSMGSFDNPITKQKSNVIINPLWINRINQIWRKGLYVMVYRDESGERVIQRVVIYKHELDKIEIHGKIYRSPWEVMIPCPNPKCGGSNLIAFVADEDFNVDETRCELACRDCDFAVGYPDFVEVEVKPPLQLMRPLRPRSTNPRWVNIKGTIPIKYALEGIDLDDLASNEGGWYYDVGSGIKGPPRFESYEDILNSDATTNFPSQKYYDDTVTTEYNEWLFYYNKIFPRMHKMVTEKFQLPVMDKSKEKRQKMEKA